MRVYTQSVGFFVFVLIVYFFLVFLFLTLFTKP